jgi:hypothetical protein
MDQEERLSSLYSSIEIWQQLGKITTATDLYNSPEHGIIEDTVFG